MRLSRLDIQGFKSFSNKTSIVFPKNITGIVGPNGSGKSNIADSVRWVLGEQNPRLLRGNKMEDIIFNGTEKRKPMSFCEVSLIFDNEDLLIHPEYSEVMVTRRVYRTGESEYEINKQPCRLKDIVEMFSDTGIGKEGYSIIGQGRIDEILSRKTEDRRAVFEEAAGIALYKLKKHEAELKLNRAEENLLRINDIANEQSKMLEPLKQQAENAKKYFELSQRLKILACGLFLIDYDRLIAKEENCKQNIDSCNKQLNDIAKDIEKTQLEINEKQLELEEITKLASEDTKNYIEIEKQIAAIKEEISSNDIRIENAKERLDRASKEHAEYSETIRGLASNTNNDIKRLETLNIELDKLNKEIGFDTENIDKYNQELKNRNSNIASLRKSYSDTQESIKQISISKASGKTKLESIEKDLQTAQNESGLILKSIEELKELLDNDKASLDKAAAELNLQKSNYANLEKNFENCVLKCREKEDKIRQSENVLSAKKSEYATLKNLAESFEGYFPAVKYAMKYARAKSLKSVYGPLAELIKVPQEYETAIDMVLGSSIQNIVVEDEKTAKILIDELRDKKSGRITLYPLSSMEASILNANEQRFLNMSGAIGLASNIIDYDKKLSNLIKNLLGRTLVIDSLESGIALRKAGCRLRMVSLKGDVMHSMGSMTGGSVKTNNNSLLSRERHLKDLQSFISQQESLIEQLRLDLDNLNDEKQNLGIQRTQEYNKMHNMELELAKDTQTHTSKRLDYERMLEQHLNLEEKVKQLQKDKESCTQSVEAAREQNKQEIENSRRIESKIENAEKDILNLSDSLKTLELSFNDKKIKQGQLNAEKNNLQRLQEDAKSNISRYENKLKELDQEILDSKTSIANMIEKGENIKATLENTNIELKAIIDKQKDSENKRQEMQSKLRSSSLYEEDLRAAQLKLYDKSHKLDLQLQSVENERLVLSREIWNKYELSYQQAKDICPLQDFSYKKAEAEKDEISLSIKELGSINTNALEEYASLKQRHDELIVQKEDVEKSISDLKMLITQLLSNMQDQFVENFMKLKEYFSESFRHLFGGGNAELILTDKNNPLDCGIDIIVQPPGKKKQILSLFSGGERALTAIALIFAMLKLKPSPFCIFDEIEAALDDANIHNFADYLKEFSKKTQFIVVTHRKGTMERCDSLYGIAMAEKGVSSMLSIDIDSYKE